MSIERVTQANLRRTQAFDAELRSAVNIDRIAAEFADALLYQKDAGKRKAKIDDLVKQIVGEADKVVLPQAEKIGRANAIDVLAKTPDPINLNDPNERAGALLRGRTRARQRLDIIRGSVDASGGTLNAALTRYWLEPSEGGDREKVARLREIHERLEVRRKTYEKALQDFNDGKIPRRPSPPNLDYLSEMTAESKKTIRQQARRAGTDAEVAVMQAKGYLKYIWVTPNGLSACPDCRNRQSVILTMAEWEAIGRPGSGRTVCEANCYCMLLPAESVASSPVLITRQHTTDRGPLTSADDLAVLNANRIDATPGAAKAINNPSAKTDLLPKPQPIQAAQVEAPPLAAGAATPAVTAAEAATIAPATTAPIVKLPRKPAAPKGIQNIKITLGNGRELEMEPLHGYDGRRHAVVIVDVDKIELEYSKATDHYVGKAGAGGIGNRYAEFGNFVDKGKPIEMSYMSFDKSGQPGFINGRHRWAWLRDNGAAQLPVTISRSDLRVAVERYGAVRVKPGEVVKPLAARPPSSVPNVEIVAPVKAPKAKKPGPAFAALEKDVDVRFRGSDVERKEFDKVTKNIFGTKATPEQVAALIGMPEGTKIVVEVRHQYIKLEAENKVGMGLGADRSIYKDKGTIAIHNNEMSLLKVDQGKGIGLSVFARQVEAARAAGVKEIVCLAARSFGDEYVGYAVWPKFGYDGPIPRAVKEAIAVALPHAAADIQSAVNVSDLMRTAEGRAAWIEHGTSFEAKFTITPDKSSLSEAVLDAYIKSKTGG